MLSLTPQLRQGGSSKIVVRFLPRYKVHKLLDSRLTIEKQSSQSRLVEMTFDDPDRVLASQVLTRIIAEFSRYTTANDRLEDTTAVAQLQEQVDSTVRRLGIAENDLRAFEERARLVAPEEQAAADVKRISEIRTKVDALTAERNALSRMLTIISDRSKGGADANAYRQLATFPTLITNRAIQDLLQSLIDLANRRSALAIRRTDENEEVKQLNTRINEIEHQLFQVGPQYLESLDQQLATTAQVVSAMADSFNMYPAAVMNYTRLVRDRTVLETIYTTLEKLLKTAELKDLLRVNRVRVVDAPRVANRKDVEFPRKVVMISLALVLGLALALTCALIAEMWRDDPFPS